MRRLIYWMLMAAIQASGPLAAWTLAELLARPSLSFVDGVVVTIMGGWLIAVLGYVTGCAVYILRWRNYLELDGRLLGARLVWPRRRHHRDYFDARWWAAEVVMGDVNSRRWSVGISVVRGRWRLRLGERHWPSR